MGTLKYFIAFFSIVFSSLKAQLTTINYVENNNTIFNPERGFYHHLETNSTSYTALNLTTLQGYKNNEKISIIMRLFYLESYNATPISNTFLSNMQQDFNTLRQAGLKCIVRFAYTNQATSSSPYGDATKAQMLAHIEQIKPVLMANADVIYTMHAGFIGTWGEWYYTTYFGDPNNGAPTATDYQNRKQVVDSLLKILPSELMVGIRTPINKMSMLNYTNLSDTLSMSQSHSLLPKARMAYHNDCFLSSPNDWYTFNNSTERQFLKSETKYMLYGGEVCSLSSENDCSNAYDTLKSYHTSYLNIDYNTQVLNKWKTQNCYNDIDLNLGYRLVMQKITHPAQVKNGNGLNLAIKLVNKGFSAPMNKKDFVLILRNQTTLTTYSFVSTSTDCRYFFANDTINLSFNIGIGSNVSVGNYDILLHLRDIYSTTQSNPNYAIQLSNTGVWETTTGYNKLSSLAISNTYTAGISYTGSNWFGTPFSTTDIANIPLKQALINIINIYPNPFNKEVNLSFYTDQEIPVNISIVDVLGREIVKQTISKTLIGVNLFNLNFENTLISKGVYFMVVTSENKTIVKKLMN